MRVAFIGFGSIARDTIAALEPGNSGVHILGALVRSPKQYTDCPGIDVCDNLDALLAFEPEVVVETASQTAVSTFGESVLAAGIPLVVVSVGALADDELRARLRDTARQHGTQLTVPAGAIGAIDALAAARLGGLYEVTLRARKPASAWKGSAAEDHFDLDALTSATTIFEGNARDASRLYPKNSNVAATIALAGTGFDTTRVELIADPSTTENTHRIAVRGRAGSFEITLCGLPSPRNPKTSMLTALSVARSLINRHEAIVV